MSDDSRSSSPVETKSDHEGSVESRESRESREPIAGRKRPRIQDPDEESDVDDANGPKPGGEDDVKNGNGNRNAEEDEEEDEDDEDEDDADDDEDDDGVDADGERKKKRRRKSKKYRFLDVEAEVDDEDEEEDEADDFGDVADFIDERPGDEPVSQDDTAHRRLDRAFGRNEQENVEDIVQRLKERHGRMAAARYNADSDTVPQRLLMPGVNDPNLWTVRVKAGRESAIIASIFRKYFMVEYATNPMDVISVFSRDSLPGMIFVEARQAASVTAAVTGIVGVFISRGVSLVPIEEMAPLLKIRKKEANLTAGMWVRMKRGKYAGDLAQVIDNDQMTSGVVGIKFIPRIDLTPKEIKKERVGRGASSHVRPPQRLFAYDDVRKIYGRGSVRQGAQGAYFFDNDEYTDGFCFKDVKATTLSTEDVNPTLEEISKFTGEDQHTAKYDLSAIADANKNSAVSVLFPGDKVEVYEGEQNGLYGLVVTVTPDVISVKAEGGEIHGHIVEVPSKSVRKRFEIGEHVKVLGGKNAKASGMVVEVKGDVVTLMSDQGEQEIKVFSKDIRKAADLAGSTAQTGLYDMHDMVMLDSSTAGVVIKIEGAMLRILDQNGAVRVLGPSQITPRRENKNFAVASDSQGNDMRVGDAMKETEGERRQGEVINIFRSLFVFLHNRELPENNGVFIARAQALVFVTPKSVTNDLTKLNPALQAQLPYGGASLMLPPSTMPNKNRLLNTLVVVVKGTNKGLMGVIKDILGQDARVELATNNKTLTLNLGFLKRKDPKTGQTYPLDTGGMGGYGAGSGGRPAPGGYDINPYGSMGPPTGGQTPGFAGGRNPGGRFGQTPNPYAGGFGGGKTPNPYGGGATGGRTPAPGWSASGGKTPGWAGDGGKTPAPGYGDGGRTPGWAGAGGGKTPNPYGSGTAVGGRTPGPSFGQSGEAGSSRGGYSAPTPYSGPTPGVSSAPTPGATSHAYAAPTPYGAPTPFSAPTPFAAPTPGAAISAPTPGVGLGGNAASTPYGAPTPYGAAPTPFGAASNGGVGGPADGIPFDWALDFRNVIVEVGPSTRTGTRNPLHFQRGVHDGKRFGYDATGPETAHCVSLDNPAVVEDIAAEYLRPARPDGPGQLVVCIAGGADVKGSQKTTSYLNEGQWMMEMEPGDMGPMVIGEEALCRIWKS